MTRASTCSQPLTEQSKRLTDVTNSAKSYRHRNVDMPLQRNLDCQDVSPIIEDDKEDTQYNDQESVLRASNRRQLLPEFTSKAGESKYVRGANKEIVNKLATQLLAKAQKFFTKEKKKQESHKKLQVNATSRNLHKSEPPKPKPTIVRGLKAKIKPKKEKRPGPSEPIKKKIRKLDRDFLKYFPKKKIKKSKSKANIKAKIIKHSVQEDKELGERPPYKDFEQIVDLKRENVIRLKTPTVDIHTSTD